MCVRYYNKGHKSAKEKAKMPFLQYKCPDCGKLFDEYVKVYTDEVFCPNCKQKAVRSYSGEMLSATGKPTKKCSGNCKTCSGCK